MDAYPVWVQGSSGDRKTRERKGRFVRRKAALVSSRWLANVRELVRRPLPQSDTEHCRELRLTCFLSDLLSHTSGANRHCTADPRVNVLGCLTFCRSHAVRTTATPERSEGSSDYCIRGTNYFHDTNAAVVECTVDTLSFVLEAQRPKYMYDCSQILLAE